jgi:tRNA(His) guanylyltransferase
MSYNDFDVRMKSYEEDTVYGSDLPVIVRVDGKAFHTYTKKFEKPFDDSIRFAMTYAAKKVIDASDAVVAYHQSDEVTFLFYRPDPMSQIYFNGRKGKLESVIASMFTYWFNDMISAMQPETDCPSPAFFDARCYQVPSLVEAANVFTWRYMDCVRNSISALAHSIYSPKQLHGVSQKQMLEMVKDIDPWERQLLANRYGTFVRKNSVENVARFNEYPIDSRVDYLVKNEPMRLKDIKNV